MNKTKHQVYCQVYCVELSLPIRDLNNNTSQKQADMRIAKNYLVENYSFSPKGNKNYKVLMDLLFSHINYSVRKIDIILPEKWDRLIL